MNLYGTNFMVQMGTTLERYGLPIALIKELVGC